MTTKQQQQQKHIQNSQQNTIFIHIYSKVYIFRTEPKTKMTKNNKKIWKKEVKVPKKMMFILYVTTQEKTTTVVNIEHRINDDFI